MDLELDQVRHQNQSYAGSCSSGRHSQSMNRLNLLDKTLPIPVATAPQLRARRQFSFNGTRYVTSGLSPSSQQHLVRIRAGQDVSHAIRMPGDGGTTNLSVSGSGNGGGGVGSYEAAGGDNSDHKQELPNRISLGDRGGGGGGGGGGGAGGAGQRVRYPRRTDNETRGSGGVSGGGTVRRKQSTSEEDLVEEEYYEEMVLAKSYHREPEPREPSSGYDQADQEAEPPRWRRTRVLKEGPGAGTEVSGTSPHRYPRRSQIFNPQNRLNLAQSILKTRMEERQMEAERKANLQKLHLNPEVNQKLNSNLMSNVNLHPHQLHHQRVKSPPLNAGILNPRPNLVSRLPLKLMEGPAAAAGSKMDYITLAGLVLGCLVSYALFFLCWYFSWLKNRVVGLRKRFLGQANLWEFFDLEDTTRYSVQTKLILAPVIIVCALLYCVVNILHLVVQVVRSDVPRTVVIFVHRMANSGLLGSLTTGMGLGLAHVPHQRWA